MSIEKIIAKLEEMAADREDILPGCLGWDEAKPLREAIALLKTHQEAQPNDPLTLEKLREMDGQPVWLNVAGGVWALVGVADGVFWMDLGGSIDMTHLEGKAYRRPPKEGA